MHLNSLRACITCYMHRSPPPFSSFRGQEMITLRPSNPEALPAGTSYTFLELHWLEGCSLAFLITIYLLWQLNEPVFSDRAVKQVFLSSNSVFLLAFIVLTSKFLFFPGLDSWYLPYSPFYVYIFSIVV